MPCRRTRNKSLSEPPAVAGGWSPGSTRLLIRDQPPATAGGTDSLTLVQSLFRLHQHPAEPYQLIEGQVKTRSIKEAALDGGGDRVVRELLENHYFKVAARAITNFEMREFGDGLAGFAGCVYGLHQCVDFFIVD